MVKNEKGISLVKRNYSQEELKKLYIQKMAAIKKKDFEFLDKLLIDCPQLFDKRFLYEMLQKELAVMGKDLPLYIHNILKKAIINSKLHYH